MASNTTGELWHKRSCHMSEKRMQKLAADDLVPEVKNVHLDKCADCLACKKKRTSFWSRPPMRQKAPLKLSEEELLLITEENEVQLVSDKITWVVDSRASCHLTPDGKCFLSYKAGENGFVKMGNEGAC